MNRIVLYLILILIPTWGTAQSQKTLSVTNKRAIENYNNALKSYDRYDLYTAEKYLKESIRIEPKFIEAYLVISQVYFQMGNTNAAIEATEKAISINPEFYPKSYYTLGRLYLQIGEYQKALQNLEHFLTFKNNSKDIVKSTNENIERCKFAINAIAHPVPFNPKNIGNEINSDLDEYWPSLSADGKTLVYTVKLPKPDNIGIKHTHWQEDFYVSTVDSTGNWTQGKPIGSPINTDINEGAQSLSSDGTQMYYTICSGVCNLYTSVLENSGSWSYPVKLPPAINTDKYSEKQPSISPDGNTLYFVSNRPGGFGGFDIWKSEKSDDGSWGNAVNLGEPINTPSDEQSPFIHFDNQTLYFSSSGHIGMGGMDIFVSRRDDSGKWSEPVNLGYPINSYKSEEGLIVDAQGTIAYYSTDIKPENGRDIFSFILNPNVRPIPTSYVKGTVKDSKTLKPLIAQITLVDLSSKKVSMKPKSNSDGKFLVCLPTNRIYGLFASAPGYLFYSANFDLKGQFSIDKPYYLEILLNPIVKDEIMIMRNIFFETDSYALKPESTVELDRLVDILNQNPTIKIEIGGHTDEVGSDEYNQKLSEQRAQSVANYLFDHSISKDRVKWVGYGESKPISTNATPEGRAQNRRTEVKILEK